jgi:acyl dehydratase
VTYQYFEDFLEGATLELGTISLTEDEIIEFAQKYDPQPMHTDISAASASIYGGLIASGWHTVARYMRLVVDNVLAGTESLGSPGVDQLRWLKPVRPGDTLRARFLILETRASNSRPDRGIVRSRGELVNQDDDVVMTIEAVNFFGRRPPDSQ